MYKAFRTEKMVTVIIPAFNEDRTISNIIQTAKTHPLVAEVIVVDDGSKDATSRVAHKSGAHVITHSYNYGKAVAMDTGVQAALTDIIFFIDGDVVGISHKMMTKAIMPVLHNHEDMHVLTVDRGAMPAWLVEHLPLLSGIRAMKKQLWKTVPPKFKQRFQIEIALNHFAARANAHVEAEVMPGLHHVIKEHKRGLVWGLYQRFFMIRDIVIVILKLQFVSRFQNIFVQEHSKK